tara:strand:- start:1058 stop:2041 length:984 start_codon:yes stop_codon:yes gene_type:complete
MEDFGVTQDQMEHVASIIYDFMSPTPQYNWPLLSQRVGAEVWVKHENHTPTGAFKIRGGLVYVDYMSGQRSASFEFIAATRGNHGQSVATAASNKGFPSRIVVPEGNSKEKNCSMVAQGAEVLTYGKDFQEAFEYATELSKADHVHMFPSFHPFLVRGVATYAWEVFKELPDLDAVYVPIGLGSGVCGVIAARDLMGLRTEIIGVVAENAPAYSLSVKSGRLISTNSANTIADGLACRVPNDTALDIIKKGVSRIVEVSESQIRSAIRCFFTDTHNVAEGAGAAALAALLKEKQKMGLKRVAVILTGGNIDNSVYQDVLNEKCEGKS